MGAARPLATVGGCTMADQRRRYLRSNEYCARYFEVTHAEGGLDPKTKELMHLALVLAFHCEP